MAEEVVSSYLRSKFSSILDEAVTDGVVSSKFIPRFQSIEGQINKMCENRSASIPVDLLYDLIDALSECRVFALEGRNTAASGKRFSFFRASPLKKMSRRLDEIEARLNSRSSPDQAMTGSSQSGLAIQQTHPVLDPSKIVGFESDAEKIEAWLMMADNNSDNEGFAAVGIVGRCGCGKTALAQKVFSSPRIVKEFSIRIWVCLSNMLCDDNEHVDPGLRVVSNILEQIGSDVSESDFADSTGVKTLEKLQSILMRQRYLIVLDDAWQVDGWYGEFISRRLPKGSGGAVIVTSRRENVVRRMVGDKHVIRLLNLTDEICWEIFSSVVRQQGKVKLDDPELNKLKQEVFKKFDGLPLAARILADIVTDRLRSQLLHVS